MPRFFGAKRTVVLINTNLYERKCNHKYKKSPGFWPGNSTINFRKTNRESKYTNIVKNKTRSPGFLSDNEKGKIKQI